MELEIQRKHGTIDTKETRKKIEKFDIAYLGNLVNVTLETFAIDKYIIFLFLLLVSGSNGLAQTLPLSCWWPVETV